MSPIYRTALSAAAALFLFSAPLMASTPQDEFIELRDAYIAQVCPLSTEANQAWWEASTTGSDAAYARREKADNLYAKLHQNTKIFTQLKALRDSKAITDPVLKRELDTMYFAFVPYQADPELTKQIISREAAVDKIFNTHRSKVNGKDLTENDVRKILSTTDNDALAKQAWLGYMQVGRKVAGPLKELVKLRNQVARKLGYRDYFAMQLDIQGYNEAELTQIFVELDQLTRAPFTELKAQIDEHMTSRFGLTDKTVRPWNLGDLFFQEAPELSSFSADSIYADKDPVKLSEAYYLSMGMDPGDIIARSDLYERSGKSPHAFESCLDHKQDIRVLCNVKPNAAWMDTVNHELGHGLYDKYINQDLSYLLRQPSHILTTEGLAMLMGEMTRTKDFLNKVVGLQGEELDKASKASWDLLRAERLIFCRWTQTMFYFEREMYKNPDQDLNKLWWSLKKQYQLQDPPADLSGDDYGAKMHVVGAPVYYHNYMLGDLFGCQLYQYIGTNVLHLDNPLDSSLYGQKLAGQYLKEQVFAPGARYDFNDLAKRATGHALSPKAFAELYVK